MLQKKCKKIVIIINHAESEVADRQTIVLYRLSTNVKYVLKLCIFTPNYSMYNIRAFIRVSIITGVFTVSEISRYLTNITLLL